MMSWDASKLCDGTFQSERWNVSAILHGQCKNFVKHWDSACQARLSYSIDEAATAQTPPKSSLIPCFFIALRAASISSNPFLLLLMCHGRCLIFYSWSCLTTVKSFIRHPFVYQNPERKFHLISLKRKSNGKIGSCGQTWKRYEPKPL